MQRTSRHLAVAAPEDTIYQLPQYGQRLARNKHKIYTLSRVR